MSDTHSRRQMHAVVRQPRLLDSSDHAAILGRSLLCAISLAPNWLRFQSEPDLPKPSASALVRPRERAFPGIHLAAESVFLEGDLYS